MPPLWEALIGRVFALALFEGGGASSVTIGFIRVAPLDMWSLMELGVEGVGFILGSYRYLRELEGLDRAVKTDLF